MYWDRNSALEPWNMIKKKKTKIENQGFQVVGSELK